MDEVGHWLEQLGLGRYTATFAENDIEFDLLSELTDADLEKLGVSSLGHRKRLLGAIAALSGETGALNDPMPTEPASEVSPPASSEAERRQLTVMFCDLVGSTELSTRFDPEDLQEVILAYQDACAKVIARYNGFIARYMGDGVLVYFGYPQAHDNDAERAAHTGLGIVEAVANVGTSCAPARDMDLAVRVGIDTGPVVVGDIIGEGAAEEASVVGETPNIAARLQALAGPNQVVIGPLTRELIGVVFACEDLGKHKLKGIAEPVQAWRVVRESDTDSRYETKRVGGGMPLVGRQEELGLLARSWEASKGGRGQAVLIQGEAGIGKSRLLEELRERVSGEDHTWIAVRCSPYHANSMLYPVIEHLKRVMDWKPEDAAEEKFEKLESALKAQSLPPEESVPLYAELMSLPLPEGRYAPLELNAEQQREQTLDALAGWLLDEAERTPVLHMWEDLHWADPTTLELLGLYIEQSPTVSMLNVLTYRPEFVPPWTAHSHMTPITLNRLERPEVETLIGHQANGKAVPAEVIEHIVAKTDGVPLYVEELTKTILESDYLKEEADRYTLSGSLSGVSIPTTLQDSLMARLDRLPKLREIAQLGSVLGREFAYELLQYLAPLEEPALQTGLGQLVENELLYQRGRPPRSRYIFKHALVQDAAYQSLLKSTRRKYHGKIARMLEERFPDTAETQPDLLAHHFTEAGLLDHAVEYWQRAGERASERSANFEAIAHLTRGLELIKGLPETPERAGQELAICVTLGPALIATKGWGTPEVEQVYLRAQELCEQVGKPAQLFTVTWGLWLHYQQVAQLETAQRLADDVLALAAEQSDPGFRLQAHHAAWTTDWRLANFAVCRDHTEQGTALYDIDQHGSHAFRYGGHDPGVCSLVHAALASWMLGYPDQALEKADDSVTLAEQLAHPFSRALAQTFLGYIHQFRQEAVLVEEHAEAAIALCAEQGFPQILGRGNVLRGWAVAARGHAETGIAEIRQGLVIVDPTGTGANRSFFLALLAEAYGHAGQAGEGLSLLAESLDLVQKSGERTWEAEINRLKGELLLVQSAKNTSEAEGCFNQAIDVARRQSAKSPELRAATSLARLWHQQGKTGEASALLAPVYDWFTEGFETADLKDAKVVLRELS